MAKPINPDKIKTRIFYLSAMNGWSIAVFAGICTMASLFFDPGLMGILVGLVITLSGYLEVVGGKRLRTGKNHPFRFLCGSQILFWISLTIYCFYQVKTVNVYELMESIPPETLQVLLDGAQTDYVSLGMVFELFLKLFYYAVILTSLIYQGGLFIYYYTRIKYLGERQIA